MTRMRAPITLDPDVERLLEETARREHRTFAEVLNDAVRSGLASLAASLQAVAPPRPSGVFQVQPHRTHLVGGHDPHALNRLADALEDESTIAKLGS